MYPILDTRVECKVLYGLAGGLFKKKLEYIQNGM